MSQGGPIRFWQPSLLHQDRHLLPAIKPLDKLPNVLYTRTMKRLLVLVLVLLIAGCSPEVRTSKDVSYDDKIIYVQDQRTGLCFAALKTEGHAFAGIATVPCEKISKELMK